MCAQIDTHFVVDIQPFGVMVHLLYFKGRHGHEAKSLDEAGEFKFTVELAVLRVPSWEELKRFGNFGVCQLMNAHGVIVAEVVVLLLSQMSCAMLPIGNPKDRMRDKTDVLQGTLALMVLKTLDVMGTLHGYGIARRIEQISGDLLTVNQGTLYPVLLKLEQEGSIASEWGASENNRKARFYRLTRDGRKRLQAETLGWQQTAEIMSRFLTAKAEELS